MRVKIHVSSSLPVLSDSIISEQYLIQPCKCIVQHFSLSPKITTGFTRLKQISSLIEQMPQKIT